MSLLNFSRTFQQVLMKPSLWRKKNIASFLNVLADEEIQGKRVLCYQVDLPLAKKLYAKRPALLHMVTKGENLAWQKKAARSQRLIVESKDLFSLVAEPSDLLILTLSDLQEADVVFAYAAGLLRPQGRLVVLSKDVHMSAETLRQMAHQKLTSVQLVMTETDVLLSARKKEGSGEA